MLSRLFPFFVDLLLELFEFFSGFDGVFFPLGKRSFEFVELIIELIKELLVAEQVQLVGG